MTELDNAWLGFYETLEYIKWLYAHPKEANKLSEESK